MRQLNRKKIVVEANQIQPERFVAEKIISDNILFCMRDTEEFYLYNSGYFHFGSVANSNVSEKINEIAKTLVLRDSGSQSESLYKINGSKKNTIIDIIKCETYFDRINFTYPPTCIFCRNGIYHTDIKAFHKYEQYKRDPYKTTHQLPVNYDPEASSDVWDTFLFELLGDKKKRNLIYEMIAYFLMPHVKYQKAFVLFGPPSSGRTTLIDGILHFLAGEYWGNLISNIRLQDLEERFQLAELRGKILNFFDDMDEDVVTKSEKFRISVTNKHLRGEIKRVQEHASWINRVKHLLATNILPQLKKDPGFQFWRRWILVACNSEFKDKTQMTEEDYKDPMVFEKDIDMLDKLTEDGALSGLLNRVIKGFERLVEREHFDKKWDNTDFVKGLWLINVNPVKLFLDEKCELDPLYEVDYELFYRELNDFRRTKNAEPITKNAMTRALQITDIQGFDTNKKVSTKYHPESCGRNYVGFRIKTTDGKELHLDKTLVKEKSLKKKTVKGEKKDMDVIEDYDGFLEEIDFQLEPKKEKDGGGAFWDR